MRTDLSLYFLALIPPGEVFEQINIIRQYVAAKYNCKQALKSPPHITIEPPFKYAKVKEDYLFDKLEQLNKSLPHKTIPIELMNYDIFPPRVIFIDVINNPILTETYQFVHSFVKNHLGIVKDLPPRPFHPHITIAFRDVKEYLCTCIMEDIQMHFPIHIQFTVRKITMLRYNNNQWNILF